MIKILVLHGFTQNDSVSRKLFSAVQNLVTGYVGAENVQFVYGCGPTPVPEDVVRALYEKFGMSLTERAMENNRCWWRTSDDNKEYKGWETALSYLQDLEQREGPFAGVMGFSQGSICGSALIARQQFFQQNGDQTPRALCNFRFGVFVAGWKPYSAVMEPWFTKPIDIPSMHMIGDTEPPESLNRCEELIKSFTNPRIVRHTAGHVVPKDESSLNDMVRFIVDQCEQINLSTNR